MPEEPDKSGEPGAMPNKDIVAPSGWSADWLGAHRRHLHPVLIVSLIWIAFPLSGFVTSHPASLRAILVGLAVLVFVGLYLWVMPKAHLRSTWAMAVMIALACVLTVRDRVDWAALFVFCAVAAGFRLGRPYCWYGIALCAPLAAGTILAGGGTVSDAISMGVTAAAVGFMILSVSRLLRSNTELREAREQLAVMAVAEERLRFARDLHDLLGHSLSVIALKADLARRLLPDSPEQADESINDIAEVARSALREVRDAVSGYREPRLDAELAGARFALSAAGIQPVIEEQAGSFPTEVDSLLAWAVREGTTNVIRHSGAHHCRITIDSCDGVASVEIADDGRGGSADGRGHGLFGLRERADRLAGTIEVSSLPGNGFSLRVMAPLEGA